VRITQNVDVVFKALGVPKTARAKAIEEVKTRRAGTTGIVQLYGAQLRRVGLM
jgi:ABC-type taurine transport system ATPase subunit